VAVSSGGKVIAANIWGKLKTVLQMSAIIYTLFALGLCSILAAPAFELILMLVADILLWASAIMCIISGVIYLLDNKDLINPEK
jgi:phosphatidylglycerophosphate synthase